MSLACVLAITLYGGYFIGANELLLGGTRPLAKFIQAQGLQDEPVMVYGKLLPSLAFNLDRDIITISDDRAGYAIARETEFQADSPTDRWKQFLDLSRSAQIAGALGGFGAIALGASCSG